MDKETKARRAALLRMQVEIEETHCKTCPRRPGEIASMSGCEVCTFGKELRTIGNALIAAVGPRRTAQKGHVIPVITDEVIVRARANDITLSALKTRVQQLMWPIEKAVTQPLDKSKRHNRKKA